MNPFKKLNFRELFLLFFSLFLVAALLEHFLLDEAYTFSEVLIRNSVLALIFSAMWHQINKAKSK